MTSFTRPSADLAFSTHFPPKRYFSYVEASVVGGANLHMEGSAVMVDPCQLFCLVLVL